MNKGMANILRVFDDATAQEVIDGMRWYRVAQSDAKRLTGLGRVKAAGIVAALSPQKRWEMNLEIAREFVRSGGLASVHVKANCDKARAILNGADPMDILGGLKVRAFYQNLADPETSGPVTIDGHAFCIWQGKRIGLGSDLRVPSSARAHSEIVQDYREAAGIVGILPHQLQAITWVAWRRLYPTESLRRSRRHDPRTELMNFAD